MQDRSSQVPHRSGLLKQTNKKHKTGGHRSKVIISVLLLCDKLSIYPLFTKPKHISLHIINLTNFRAQLIMQIKEELTRKPLIWELLNPKDSNRVEKIVSIN